jgi:hypothetical protein
MEVVGPLRGGSACLPDDPLAHRHDEADFLGQRDEVGRRDHSPDRMIPAYQGFEAADFLARQIDDRLVVQLELTSGSALRRSCSMMRRVCICRSIAGSKKRNVPRPSLLAR